ncbi:MAG TPA: hypothetical protein VGZ32_27505 [Actinocrinis sp.]|jgi:hypothetical protein|uniref:hypothetical protein n=1 Tax=Actinocrinis sp. TaxID=1920516 RepID=UPI002DDDB02F|nr:hypothetical protein [Actinocrinis sp.]HEV3174126.1 hypothetical protein [Actinocrinis sp.]
MTTTDYVIAAVLVLLVVPQIRGTRLTLRNLILPVVLVAAAAAYYLKSVPTQGHDVLLDVVCVAVGALLGIGCGLATRFVRDSGGFLVAKAGFVAAVLWIVGMASRTGFEYAATHSGAHAIADFSRSNSITGSDAWTAALLLMALAQVIARLVTVRLRGRVHDARPAALARA